MEDKLILVDEYDNEIGSADKMTIHLKGLRHRAFSLFIYDRKNNKMLIQKRATNKYHSGGLWSNACCSHMKFEYSILELITDTIQRELGVSKDYLLSICNQMMTDEENILKYCGCFSYYVNLGELFENEIDHIFLLNLCEDVNLKENPDEVDELKWIELIELEKLIKSNPKSFTAWFLQAFAIVKKMLN